MFRTVKAENGVEYLESSLLSGCIHGFSTRKGGVSVNEHTSSLNLAFGRGDAEDTVLKNLSLFADAVGFDPHKLVSVPQIHSTDIIEASTELGGEGIFRNSGLCGDGYVISGAGIFAAVKTADCVPILMYDPQKKIAAAVHAGWRGTFGRIAEKGVRKMLALGAEATDIMAAIGPAVNGECYEVGQDVYLAAAECFSSVPGVVFTPGRESGKYYCDLKNANRLILLECGVRAENIDVCTVCTHCRTDMFYSHRASGGKRGTMMSVIGIK